MKRVTVKVPRNLGTLTVSGGNIEDGTSFSAAVSLDGCLYTWGAGGDFYLMGNGGHLSPHELAVGRDTPRPRAGRGMSRSRASRSRA